MKNNIWSKAFGIKLIIVITTIVLLVLAGIRLIHLNKKYPSPTVQSFAQNEKLELGNYSFTLKDWKWYTGEIVHELMPGYQLVTISDEEYPVEKERVGLATVTIGKKEEDDTYLDLTNITFESGAWGNQWDHELMMGINKDLNSLMIELKAGENLDVIFPITMLDLHFSKKEWANIDRRDFNIVIEYYPVKSQLVCNNSNTKE